MLGADVLMDAGLAGAAAPPSAPPLVVARYSGCEIATNADDAEMHAWKDRFAKKYMSSTSSQHVCGPSFCNLAENLYFYDRCWNPRQTCAVRVESKPPAAGSGSKTQQAPPSSTLVVAQGKAESSGKELLRGQYFAVLGPAAAFGVASEVGFADMITESLKKPVLNLGRGGAGPSLYLGAENEHVTEVLAQSRAVIILVMAGRSSANSAFPFGISAMDRARGVEQIRRTNPARAARLMNESLKTAADEYATIASRIRKKAEELQSKPPQLLLLWLSECDLATGCHHPGLYPQFYTTGAHAQVRFIAKRMGARIVDASYGHVAPPKPMPLNRCSQCTTSMLSGRGACTMDGARFEMDAVSMRGSGSGSSSASRTKGCTKTCKSVLPGYYPHEAAHRHAAHVLMRELRWIDSASPPTARERRGGLMAHSLLPRIDLSKKIFFNHVHKSAGSTFTTFLRSSVPGVTWCSDLVSADMVHTPSEARFTNWWFDALPNCSFVALEEPSLGEVMTMMTNAREARTSDTMSDFYEPQVMTFYRDPYERCQSEWRYEQALCHPKGGLANRPSHIRDYCQSWFLPRFGNYNRTETHKAFAREYCAERVSRDLERHGWSFRELSRSDRLLFVGLADDYFASICLFWYQAGKFPRDTCSCAAARKAGQKGSTVELEAKGLRRSFSYTGRFESSGLPVLRITPQEFDARNIGDMELYKQARATFQMRVRAAERRVGQNFTACAQSITKWDRSQQ